MAQLALPLVDEYGVDVAERDACWRRVGDAHAAGLPYRHLLPPELPAGHPWKAPSGRKAKEEDSSAERK